MRSIREILFVLTRREKKRLGMLLLLDIVISIADIFFLALLLFIIHFYTENTWTNKLPFLTRWLTDHNSMWPIAIFFFLFSVKNGVSFLSYSAQARFRYGVASRISQNNLLRYLAGKFSDYTNIDSSVHIMKIAQQPIEFCQYVLAGIQQGVTELTLISVTIIAVLLFNAKLFLLLLILLLPPVILASWLTKRKLHAAREYIKTSREIMWQHLQESIAGFVESNLYEKNNFFANRYGRAQAILNRHLSSLHAMQGGPSRLAEVFAVFGLLILIAIGHYSGHGAEIVTMGAFLAAAYKIIPGIARILNIAGQLRTYKFTMTDLVKKEMNANLTTKDKDIDHIHAVTCRHLGFRFGKTKILEDFNLHLRRGDFLGIQGSSGKGKTTLLNIILGFIAPEKGKVLINEMEIDRRAPDKYWKHIAYVKQQPFIIHDSILANITLDEKEFEPERLQSAVSFSGLDELIRKLPGGIDARISESGKNVSGGQRQRIAIARAIYKDADLIILDEPFSELDDAAEERLLRQFKQLAQEGKLIIMITHNKKSLAFCNSILSLDEETIADVREEL